MPLSYCLSREFLARDTRGYAFVEGIYIYIYRFSLFLNRRQQKCRTATDREPNPHGGFGDSCCASAFIKTRMRTLSC